MRTSPVQSLSCGIAALALATATLAQDRYAEQFNGGNAGWTVQGGYQNEWFADGTACGGGGGALRTNLYGGTPTGEFVSPLTVIADGGPLSVSYDYKVCNWSANTVPAASPWGSFDVQYGPTPTGPWTTIASITDEVQNGSCNNRAHDFVPPVGPVFLRFVGTWTGGDYWLNLDNVDVFSPCDADAPANHATFGTGCTAPGASPAMSLSATPDPVSTPTTGTNVTYTVADAPETAPGSGLALGLNIISFTGNEAGIDLGLLGAPGCNAYIGNIDLSFPFIGPPASHSTAFAIPPGVPPGVDLYAQAAALIVPSGQNQLGIVTSQAVLTQVGTVSGYANVCGLVNTWRKKAGGTLPQAPDEWESMPGSNTSQGLINWLYSWDISTDPCNLGDISVSISAIFGDSLTNAQKQAIVTACQGEANTLAKALCAGQAIKALFDSDDSYVCRHHAKALESVLECLGISANLECAYKIPGGGHAWVEITHNGNRYLLDCYNDIYVCVD